MTETLNYNPTDPNAPEFSEDEQNSLEVAEKLGQEESELYAGKYENAEELEQAYLELQKKLGSNDEDSETDTLDNDEVEDEEWSEGASLIADASNEFYSNDGKISPETLEKFSSMSSQDLVNAYLEIQKTNPQAQQQGVEMSNAQVNSVQNAAGGEANYNRVVEWAASNLANAQIDAFDSVVDTGNPAAIGIAFQGLQSAYNEANGYEGRMLQGKAPSSAGETFRSQAELVAAMGDPRYDTDPAYRADVVEKLNNSDLNF